jgi:hypothetical protein
MLELHLYSVCSAAIIANVCVSLSGWGLRPVRIVGMADPFKDFASMDSMGNNTLKYDM